MKKYGKKTRVIFISLAMVGIVLILGSLVFLIFNNRVLFEGLMSLSAVFIFSSIIIYVIIYRQFKKLEKIADEIENGRI